MNGERRARLVAAALAALVFEGLAVVPAAPATAQVGLPVGVAEVSGLVSGVLERPLPIAARYVAAHWAGHPDAAVTISLSLDGSTFSAPVDAGRDEVGERRGDGRTYGALIPARGAVAVRVAADRPLGRVTVVAFGDGLLETRALLPALPTAAAPAAPAIVPRSGWGADEKLRFDRRGREVWPPVFQTTQKLVVHHTAGINNDPNPQATIRAIYQYHAVTQGWGDIGYNFLIDEGGRIYKGRHSHTTASSSPTANDDTITGENAGGQGVTAGHAFGFNSGTVGVALLGTLTGQDATPAAKDALAQFLTGKAAAHGLDATGASVYTNPVNGTQATFPNVAGHREVPDNATECPGDAFVASSLPGLRVTVRAAAGTADSAPPSVPAAVAAAAAKRKVTLTWGQSTDGGSGGGVSGVAGYEVARASAAAGPYAVLARTTATSYVDSGAPSGTATWYQVRAYDGAGNLSGGSTPARAAP